MLKDNQYRKYYDAISNCIVLINNKSYVRAKLFTKSTLDLISAKCKKLEEEHAEKNRIEIIPILLHCTLSEICYSLNLLNNHLPIIDSESASEIVHSVLCQYLTSWLEKNEKMKKSFVEYYRYKNWKQVRVESNDVRHLGRSQKEYNAMIEAQKQRTKKLKGERSSVTSETASRSKYNLLELFLFDMYSKSSKGKQKSRQKDGIWRFWKVFFKNDYPFEAMNSEEITKGIREAYEHYDALINNIQHYANEKDYVIYALLLRKLELTYRITTFGKAAKYINDKNVQMEDYTLPEPLRAYCQGILLPFRYKKRGKSIAYSVFLDQRYRMVEACFENDCFDETNYVYLLRILADLTLAVYNYCYPSKLRTEWTLQDYQAIESFLKDTYLIDARIIPMHFTDGKYYNTILKLLKNDKNVDQSAINYFRKQREK